MANTRSYSRFRKHGSRLVAALVIVLLITGVLFAGASFAQTTLKNQGAQSIRASILDSAKQCAAIEGAYPISLSYLEDNYGLVLNYKDYVINYEVFAQNVMPTVTVVPR